MLRKVKFKVDREYVKQNKYPALKYKTINCMNLKQQSLLNLYGYNVRQDELSEYGLSRYNFVWLILVVLFITVVPVYNNIIPIP